MPIEDISYGWIDNLTEEGKVSAIEEVENPWPSCAGRYQKGNEYVGIISGMHEYGIFIKLESGVDSLLRHLKFPRCRKRGSGTCLGA